MRISQTSDDVLFGCHRTVFSRICCANARRKGLDDHIVVRAAEERNRLTGGDYASRVVHPLRWWGYHPMERGAKYIITPACK